MNQEEFRHVFDEFKVKKKIDELTEDNIIELFHSLDLNGSGLIDYTEFIAAFMLNDVYQDENYLIQVFKTLDAVTFVFIRIMMEKLLKKN